MDAWTLNIGGNSSDSSGSSFPLCFNSMLRARGARERTLGAVSNVRMSEEKESEVLEAWTIHGLIELRCVQEFYVGRDATKEDVEFGGDCGSMEERG